MSKKIVGAFHTEQEATKAIEDLKQQGYSADEISVIAKDRDEAQHISDETETKAPEGLASGAATGGVVGGVTGLLAGLGALAIPGIGPIVAAGPIAATLTGAAVGAGAGGLVGGLIGLGIPEEEAKEYDEFVEEGRILVLVDTDDHRSDGVYDTFRRNNTLNAHHYAGVGGLNTGMDDPEPSRDASLGHTGSGIVPGRADAEASASSTAGDGGDSSLGDASYGGAGSTLDHDPEVAAAAEDTVQDPNLYQGQGAGYGGASNPDPNSAENIKLAEEEQRGAAAAADDLNNDRDRR
ncbi:general stress protein [Paenibacillus sp. F411]|uniref:General stress protein 17M-like domain-containing protein n=1 Tax=Paenibacillus algicola TaxID=2565926 RepID=A0A4V1G3P2_9BACL|nr:general stress protein [Paenibacillus sp. F411]MBO2944016.1 general stress protein [Paenibacillus sp. F411]QCT01884.1 hypothetical protein E6C60_1166 [Paenibacillus algicola]